MKKLTTVVVAEIAVLAAIEWVLSILEESYSQTFWPNGGSLGISMIAVVIITYRRGLIPGLICGFITGILGMLPLYTVGDTWYKVFFQISLDYLIANPLLAFGTWLFRRLYLKSKGKKEIIFAVLGVIAGSLLKFLSHFWAGVLFWEVYCDYDKYKNVYTYSFFYNGTCILISMVLTAIVMGIFAYKYPQFTKISEEE